MSGRSSKIRDIGGSSRGHSPRGGGGGRHGGGGFDDLRGGGGGGARGKKGMFARPPADAISGHAALDFLTKRPTAVDDDPTSSITRPIHDMLDNVF